MLSKTRNVSVFVLIVLLFTTTASARPTAKITAKALDEQGAAIEGAIVHIGFEIPNNTGIGTTEIRKTGTTDKKGEFTASADSMNSLGFSVDKEGYYQSGVGYEFKSRSLLLNRWAPWNPTVEVVLKKKRNPVPMYIKGTDNLKVPQFDTPIGYDLEKGDLVSPYGSGKTSDFIFTMHAVERAYTDYECSFTLTFSNEQDGIQEYCFDPKNQSNFKWPFDAPETGYTEKISKVKFMSPGKGYKSNEKETVRYIFRVRTKTDKDGKVISALYGKINKEFEFDPKGSIFFGYYFNPDGTRNLEEDPEKNLFKK